MIEGAIAAVRRLAPEFRLGLASSSNRPLIEPVLERAGIADFATACFIRGGRARQPAPDVYLEAMRRLGVDPCAAAVEDSETGFRPRTARGCG